MLKYNDTWPFATNLAELAGALAGQVRLLEDQRARVESGPNHPSLKANDLAALDAQLGPLRMRSLAAEEGLYFYDPRDPSGGDRDAQVWVARARERGMLVNPSNYGPSLHANETDEDSPIKVIRGGNGSFDMSSPTVSVR